MPFDSNDYPLSREYQARMIRQVQQDQLAKTARTSSSRGAERGRRRVTFAVVAVVLTTILFAGLQYSLMLTAA
jgi:hypothetical protein